MIRWKGDIMARLKEAGYSTYRIRQQNLMGQQMLTKLRKGELPSWVTLGKICDWLGCQPGDLIENVPENENTPDAEASGVRE